MGVQDGMIQKRHISAALITSRSTATMQETKTSRLSSVTISIPTTKTDGSLLITKHGKEWTQPLRRRLDKNADYHGDDGDHNGDEDQHGDDDEHSGDDSHDDEDFHVLPAPKDGTLDAAIEKATR